MIAVKRSRMGWVRHHLLMPFPCWWNAQVRHWTAEFERLIWNLRGGERGLYRRMCRDFDVCLEYKEV